MQNALKDDVWKDNPDVKLGMVSYYGLPIQWPDKEFFGTICVLDNRENFFSDVYRELISEFRLTVEADLELLSQKLEIEKALDKIKTLSGLVPICCVCKKIRDDRGFWNRLESYIEKNSDVKFSHGISPESADQVYTDEAWYRENGKNPLNKKA